jgi:hypothetical protein
MRHRLPIVLSSTALAVALFGATPLGEAAGDLAGKIVPRAKRADYAANAGAVNGIKASRTPKAGFLVPLGAGGKLPSSVVGGIAAGTTLSDREVAFAFSATSSDATRLAKATCPGTKKVISGGAVINLLGIAALAASRPEGDNAWLVTAYETTAYAGNWTVGVFAICAKVS